MTDRSLCFLKATELRHLIASRQVSACEVLDAHLAQIEAVNPSVNAIVTLVPEHAREQAKRIDALLARGEPAPLLAGLPVVHKDLFQTRGIRTTFGSRLHADFVPETNALVVDRLVSAGAISVGKSNTPEWGAGSQTFNDVFGATLNPWDTGRTCGGSSGGAAVALACRMVPIADGSDMGGSLRNPANFCNVTGFRVSPGRVPAWPGDLGWDVLGVQGPMARNVADCALMLAAIAGPDPRSPISLEAPGETFLRDLARDFTGVRIAFSPDFGGQLPVSREVIDVCVTAAGALGSLGCELDMTCPELGAADGIFNTLRAWSFTARHGESVRAQPDMYKDTVVWNVQEGEKLSGEDIARAEQARTRLYHEVRTFMEDYEFLVLPVSQVAPFDVNVEWVREIDGEPMHTYIDWMKSCYYISVLGLPAISVPCGFTPGGLPVGIQIVGRHRADFSVLQLAAAFEQVTDHWERIPPVARP